MTISLLQQLSSLVGQAFEVQGLPADLGAVRVSDRPDLAQFQCNGAMAAAKMAKKNPREIAQSLCDDLSKNELFEKVEIAGPGFINLNVSNMVLQNQLNRMGTDDRLCAPFMGTGMVVLDYGGMNIAKAMHVGHFRPSVIGDCLKRILVFSGYNAIGDIHLGDWGLQMGQIISEFKIRNPDWPYFDPDFRGSYPEQPPFSYEELEEIYPFASQACKDDPDRLEVARQATADLQSGRAGYVALWQKFITLSVADIKSNLEPLNIDFELWKGEADAAKLVPEVARDLDKKGVTHISDGAVVITVAKNDDKKELPPLLFFKSDGAVTYGTTDIATIYERVETYTDLKKIIYVVDTRQSLHFEQVFRAVEKAGYTKGVELLHIGNGTVNGADGKPYKTREGNAMKFADMISTAVEKAQNRLDEAKLALDMSPEERADIAKKVAVAALKFTELSNQPHMNYIFDLDQMTAFEGKTGPYLLYQAVRIKSLLAKAQAQNIIPAQDITQLQEEDKNLALLLCEFPEIFGLAASQYSPHYLCEYAHKLAQGFSSFYGNCHILSEQDEALRASRLRLCQMTYNQLEVLLSLLGISIPDKM